MSDFHSSRLHDCRDLVALFDHTFALDYHTCLKAGAEEPFYQPARSPDQVHQIWFTRDYFASALHEVAHWCVAGQRRRQLPDYGYWYAPDGRSLAQQAAFERVEAGPQALEWLFSRAAGFTFQPSADNLTADAGSSDAFKAAIHEQVMGFCNTGVSPRVAAFLRALLGFYGTGEYGTGERLDALLKPGFSPEASSYDSCFGVQSGSPGGRPGSSEPRNLSYERIAGLPGGCGSGALDSVGRPELDRFAQDMGFGTAFTRRARD